MVGNLADSALSPAEWHAREAMMRRGFVIPLEDLVLRMAQEKVKIEMEERAVTATDAICPECHEAGTLTFYELARNRPYEFTHHRRQAEDEIIPSQTPDWPKELPVNNDQIMAAQRYEWERRLAQERLAYAQAKMSWELARQFESDIKRFIEKVAGKSETPVTEDTEALRGYFR